MADRKEGHCPLCACPLLCSGHLPRCPGVKRVAEVLGEIRGQRSDPVAAHPSGEGGAAVGHVEPLDMVKAMAVTSMMLMDYIGPPGAAAVSRAIIKARNDIDGAKSLPTAVETQHGVLVCDDIAGERSSWLLPWQRDLAPLLLLAKSVTDLLTDPSAPLGKCSDARRASPTRLPG